MLESEFGTHFECENIEDYVCYFRHGTLLYLSWNKVLYETRATSGLHCTALEQHKALALRARALI